MTHLDLTRQPAAILRCTLLTFLGLVGAALAAGSQAAPPPASAFGRSPALDFWLAQAATRVRMLRELEAFLAGQLLPASPTPP